MPELLACPGAKSANRLHVTTSQPMTGSSETVASPWGSNLPHRGMLRRQVVPQKHSSATDTTNTECRKNAFSSVPLAFQQLSADVKRKRRLTYTCVSHICLSYLTRQFHAAAL